ncbi:precorrin-6y C5,15-methyltransferase (decarboxylating) subunit CbiE [Nocardia blacklockiae]|uniref:precorrin-6y C5,15-methyltransferase (decarboxylating) subunit CbiE n=1 Tax=Nocardia blacklockiae TaxID=480036 RepID=UPI0018937203|nr:precorrin-6y C5,15-methyltransferase (decarboxylating) subunit CbiE [Nocardia blacklockiae]MBF6170547.1 precorrin-6y C5,15-methyltransferase (decarboxylating) subunit CbiE [Nocardia blacklockiae]
MSEPAVVPTWPVERPIAVVGIGADGWAGLGEAARRAVSAADVVFGSARQLTLIPAEADRPRRMSWPSPLVPALPELLAAQRDHRVCVLASGDPMFYGIGVTLTKLVGPQALRVLPQPSSASLACARLGWSLAETPVVSAVGRPLATVLPELADGRRILVLIPDEKAPARLAELLAHNGFGQSPMTVLEQLGGPAERLVPGVAETWSEPPGDPLALVAVDCVADPAAARLTRIPGLPDSAYGGDGQLTKAEVRALALSALAPAPGELLWDVGGGSGTIAIEWCRTHSACRAVTFERSAPRRAQITENAAALGVPGVDVRGEVLAELDGHDLPAPDAIFLGGGLTQPGVFDTCWARLRSGGRLVADAVTVESEAALVNWAAAHGGALRKIQIQRAEPLGGFTAWRPHLPVTQWSVTKIG